MAPAQTKIFEVLARVDPDALPGSPADESDRSCEGAKFHSPSPLLLHDVELPSGRRARLCGSCRDNLVVLQRLHQVEPDLPWEVRREFGNRLRALLQEVNDHG